MLRLALSIAFASATLFLAMPTEADAAKRKGVRATVQTTATPSVQRPVVQGVRRGCGTSLRGGNSAKTFMRQQGRGCF